MSGKAACLLAKGTLHYVNLNLSHSSSALIYSTYRYIYYVFHLGELKEMSSLKWPWKNRNSFCLHEKKQVLLGDMIILALAGLCTCGIWDIQGSWGSNGSIEWIRPPWAKNICWLGICERSTESCWVTDIYRSHFIIDFEIVAVFPTYFLLCPLDQEDEGIQEDIRHPTHNCLWLWLVCFYCCL